MNIIKVTLPSKNGQCEVLLKEPKIDDIETATQVAGKIAGDNHAHMSILLQKELLKRLLHSVDGKVLNLKDKAQLDKLFTVPQYIRLTKVVQQITDDGMGNDPEGLISFCESESTTSGELLPG